jgi:hypothetical protein
MNNCIQIATLCVQILALFGLVWYVIETSRIREASQRQIVISQNQVEGMSKPCLTLWGGLRDAADAILQMDGAVGNIVAATDGGSYVVLNIGNGVALNVRYRFTRPNQGERELRYIPHLAPTARATLVETWGGYNAEHEATFDYESISGRKYRTTIHLNHHVITSFDFEEVTQ